MAIFHIEGARHFGMRIPCLPSRLAMRDSQALVRRTERAPSNRENDIMEWAIQALASAAHSVFFAWTRGELGLCRGTVCRGNDLSFSCCCYNCSTSNRGVFWNLLINSQILLGHAWCCCCSTGRAPLSPMLPSDYL